VTSDIRAQQAREHHRRSRALAGEAARHREQRDRLIRQLRAGDPERWTYPALARAVGCSPELIAYVVKNTGHAEKAPASRKGRPGP
jgi:Mitochondrial ribosomal protein subunit L20